MTAWLCLIAAVVAFGTAALLQAYGARRVTETSTGHLVLQLSRNGPYVLGTALDILAVVLTARALATLPLFLVQAATSASLCITAIGSTVLFPNERYSQPRRTWVAIIGVTCGLTLLGSAAQGGRSTGLDAGLALLAIGVPLIIGITMMTERRPPRRLGVLLAVLAGLSYAGMGISLRALGVASGLYATITHPAAIIAACYMGCAFVLFAKALQNCKVTLAMAVVVSIDTILPAGIGILVLGDRIRPHWTAAAIVGLAITVAATLQVIRASDTEALTPQETAWPPSPHDVDRLDRVWPDTGRSGGLL